MEFDKEFWTTLFLTIINITVLYFILKKILFKPVTKFMTDRTSKIDEALKMAEEAKASLANIEEKQALKLKEIKKEGTTLMNDYKKKAQAEYNAILENAKKDSEILAQNTKMELAAEQERLMASLKDDITNLVLETSEKVIKKNIDNKDNRKFIEDFIEEDK